MNIDKIFRVYANREFFRHERRRSQMVHKKISMASWNHVGRVQSQSPRSSPAKKENKHKKVQSESRLAIKKHLAKTHGNGGFFRTSLNFDGIERIPIQGKELLQLSGRRAISKSPKIVPTTGIGEDIGSPCDVTPTRAESMSDGSLERPKMRKRAQQ